jgi:surface antigen
VQDIAKWIDAKKGYSFALLRSAAICLPVLALSGCMGAGLDLFGSGVDRTVSTGTVPVAKTSDGLSDAVMVRNAVTSAELNSGAINPIPWANATSGSAGVISSIQEDRASGMLCRRFTTTRHSYEGIAKFDGSTCQGGDGAWYLTSFGPRA